MTRMMIRMGNRKYRIRMRFLLWMLLLVLLLCSTILFISFRAGYRHYVEDSRAKFGCTYEQGLRVMLAARAYINTKGLHYDTSYFSGGYPPKDRGVCTDVVWNGLKGLDVDLKSRLDEDTVRDFSAYASVRSWRDTGLDFRLAPMQRVYFDRHAVTLSCNPKNLLAWQPGDLVVFDDQHVAVVSDIRNLFGYPYVIQHGKDPAAEEDRLINDELKLTNHYRWPETITMEGTRK